MAFRLDHGADDLAEVHEINVTPFIDVMLVLLIIFMVAAPLATADVAVDLPVSTAEPQRRPDKRLFLTLKDDHSLALGNEAVAEEDFGPALDAASGNDKDQRIDKQVDYGALMELMNKLRGAGYLKVARRARCGRDMMTITADGFEHRDTVGTIRWTVSLLVVLALHGGLLLIIMLRQLPIEPIGMPPAAVMIDLAPLPSVAPAASSPTPPEPEGRAPPPEPPPEPQPLPELEIPKLAPSRHCIRP